MSAHYSKSVCTIIMQTSLGIHMDISSMFISQYM